MARSRVVGVVSTGQSGTRAWRCRGRVKCLLSSGSGPEFVFVHTQTHPDKRGAHPKSHPRPRAHSLARKQTFACTENQLSDEKCTQANHEQTMHKGEEGSRVAKHWQWSAKCWCPDRLTLWGVESRMEGRLMYHARQQITTSFAQGQRRASKQT